MPLVAAKCTSCGAALQVNSEADAAVCQFCNTPFIVEKAINHYNVTNNISAAVVNVYGGMKQDFEIRGGVLEKYNGSATNVVVPDGVVAIGGGAFQNCKSLRSVVLPEGVTEIMSRDGRDSRGAFYDCTNLTRVMLPNSLRKIGISAFHMCTGLTEIIMQDGVTQIGSEAFAYCTSLKNIDFSNGVQRIWAEAFKSCTGLTNITIPGSVLEIDSWAFRDCTELTTVTILSSATKVDAYAFRGCARLINVTYPPGFMSAFMDTPYGKRMEQAKLQAERKQKGLCVYCGGGERTMFGKCKHCGKKNP